MPTVKERIDQVNEIFRRAAVEAGPLMADLKQYRAAIAKAEALGLTADSTADEVIEAFARGVDIGPPLREQIPQVLATGAPAEIDKAAQTLIETHKALGATVGQIAGIVLGLM
jgi:hypothetical protein